MRHFWLLLVLPLIGQVAADAGHVHCPSVEVASLNGPAVFVQVSHLGDPVPARICALDGSTIHTATYLMLRGDQSLQIRAPDGHATIVIETEQASQGVAFAKGMCPGDYGLHFTSDADGLGIPVLSCIETAGAAAPRIGANILLSLGAVFLLAIWMSTWRAPLLGLFSHIHGDAALNNDRRRQIIDLVTDNPGIRMHQIGEALGLGGGALRHHVDVLARTGHLHATTVGQHRHFFPAGRFDRHAMRRMALLEEPPVGETYGRLEDTPMPLAELARRCGRSLSWTSRVVARMAAAGLVDKHRDGGRVMVRALRA